MKVLAIETSCDETSAAVLEQTSNGRIIAHASVIASSLALHSQTGGIIPEVAAREQVKFIIPVIEEALDKSGFTKDNPDIDAIAVTYGPGLIGSLLVGVETAKTLALLWNKPLIPVNHLYGHLYANFIDLQDDMQFPAVGLIVSGGHTDLVYMKDATHVEWMGGTRDDAAGECFDKSGRLLGLPYPAGPEIEKRAKSGTPKAFHFPRARLDDPYDFSFSGLKTAVLRKVEEIKQGDADIPDQKKADLCYALQDAIFDMLLTTTFKAVKDKHVHTIILGGGVTANQTLVEKFHSQCEELQMRCFAPERKYSTDNAAMIGAAALMHPETKPLEEVTANPELYFD